MLQGFSDDLDNLFAKYTSNNNNNNTNTAPTPSADSLQTPVIV